MNGSGKHGLPLPFRRLPWAATNAIVRGDAPVLGDSSRPLRPKRDRTGSWRVCSISPELHGDDAGPWRRADPASVYTTAPPLDSAHARHSSRANVAARRPSRAGAPARWWSRPSRSSGRARRDPHWAIPLVSSRAGRMSGPRAPAPAGRQEALVIRTRRNPAVKDAGVP
jgi:hypothetical protein